MMFFVKMIAISLVLGVPVEVDANLFKRFMNCTYSDYTCYKPVAGKAGLHASQENTLTADWRPHCETVSFKDYNDDGLISANDVCKIMKASSSFEECTDAGGGNG